jgi:L-threonylcarbamoyladenylate synthase
VRLPANRDNIQHCAILLKAGEIVAIPSETVYGLAANATDESAVRRIFRVKGRPLIDPLICHFSSLEAVSAYALVSSQMEILAEAFWPGALTIVTQKRDRIPDIVTAGLPSVAVRIPSQPTFRSLLSAVDFPLAAPSANPFSYISPSSASQVEQTLGQKIPAILDDGPSAIGIESTILDLRNPNCPAVLRHGPVLPEELEQVLKLQVENKVPIVSANKKGDPDTQLAPGGMNRHYSPNTELVLLQHGSSEKISYHPEAAYLLIQRPAVNEPNRDNLFWLSEDGALPIVARNLFSMLQKLDHLGYKKIVIERCPEKGVGTAINDRLERAAAKAR